MANFRVSYVFESPSGGWTESFYYVANTIDDVPESPSGELQAVVNWRGNGVKLKGKKITEEGGLRVSKIVPINHTVAGTGNPDVSEVSVKMRLNFVGGGSRLLDIRGVRDDWILASSTGESQPSSALLQKLNVYFQFVSIVFNPFGAAGNAFFYYGRRKKPITEAGFEWNDVVSITADPANANWTQVTVSELQNPIPVGSLIYFKGIDPLQIPWIKGNYRTVGLTSTTTFSIPTRYREPIAVTALRNVQFRVLGYDYPAIAQGGFFRIGTRQTAGPFGQRRGARSGARTR